MQTCLRPGRFIDSDHPAVVEFAETWRLAFANPGDVTVSETVGGMTVTMRETGSIQATAGVAIPTAYKAWLGDHGLSNVSYGGRHPANGIPNGVLFALGLAPRQGASIPFVPHPSIANGLIIETPASGTAAPLVIEKPATLTVSKPG